MLSSVFFGRLKGAWRITGDIYRLDHSHFDYDVDNCILLTNELIAKAPLQAEDQIGFLAHQEKMKFMNSNIK